ncbi:MAG: hypothetical protein PHW69_09170 [Elusimicrobiaceae bacterium]|nr:hypothetical protein [Elusimicrobiaceae bacterium]
MKKAFAIAVAVFVSFTCPGWCAQGYAYETFVAQSAADGVSEYPHEFLEAARDFIVTVPKLPPIGKWMFDNDRMPARWRGLKHRSWMLIEPINVIILDVVSRSGQEATEFLLNACGAAGYRDRGIHSGGYFGYIDGAYCASISGFGRAFSDAPCLLPNNHGRIFGPVRGRNCWIFIAAFSRENVSPLLKHTYASITEAREAFVRSMVRQGQYQNGPYKWLNNAIYASREVSTGDHDGRAAVLIRLY